MPNIPADPLRDIKKNLLFDIYTPQVGNTTSPTLPMLLIEAALDSACRVADSLKKKKTELTIGEVRARLQKEIERFLKKH